MAEQSWKHTKKKRKEKREGSSKEIVSNLVFNAQSTSMVIGRASNEEIV